MSYERERERTSRDLEDAGNCVQCHLEYSEDGNGKANIDMLGGPGSGKEGEGRETRSYSSLWLRLTTEVRLSISPAFPWFGYEPINPPLIT